jgi:hypothetical protein
MKLGILAKCGVERPTASRIARPSRKGEARVGPGETM